MLLALLLAQLAVPNPRGPIVGNPASFALPAFSAFTANGRGVHSPTPLCNTLEAGDKSGAWLCMRGDGTFASGGASLTKTGSDTDATGYVCGGGDVLMAGRNPGGTSGARWSAASSRVGSANYTTCAHVVPLVGASEQPLLTWASGSSGAQLGISPYLNAAATSLNTYYANGGPCGTISVGTHATALVPGAAALLCVRVQDGATDLDLFINGTKHTVTTAGTNIGCDDGTSQTYSVNSYGGAATGNNASRMLGAFATETALSDARIQAISAAVLGVTHTGAKGEALTFTRASGASGVKVVGGLSTTGIPNGSIVACGVDQMRLERDSNGLLGARAAEESRMNSLVRSQEFDNAAWTKGPAVGTITANYAVAPDGTTTADRYQYSNTNNDYILQNFSCPGIACAASIFLRGTSVGGTLNLCRGGGVGQCVTCSYVADSWSRCRYEATLATSSNVFIGCETVTLGGACAQTGFDVLIWQGQGEVGAYATSPIPTTSATATRSAETLTAPGSALPVTPVSFAVSVTTPWSGTATAADMLTGNVGSNSGWAFGWTGGALRSQPCTAGVCGTLDVAQGPTAGVTSRWAVSYSGTQTTILKDAAIIAGPAARTAPNSPWATNVGVGSGVAWGRLNGIISDICVDPNPARCR